MAGFPPRKNEALTIVFPIFGPDGNPLTAAAGLDSERSLDGAGFADCVNEAAEIGATGWYSLLLAAGDMNGNVVAVQTKTTTAGAKTACHTFYTQTRAIDDLAFPATAGRSILVEADGMVHADVKEWLGVAMNALQAGRVDSYTGAMAANVITAAAIAAGAITAVEAPNLDAAVSSRSSHNAAAIWAVAVRDLTALGFNLANTDFAAGAIDANAIAANAIGASEFAQAAADKIWASAARTLTGLGFTLTTGDFAAGYLTAGLIAANAIGASEFTQAAADKIWTSAARTLTALGFNLAAGDFAAGAIDGNALAASAINKIADGVWDEDIEAAHGGDASAGLLLRALGAAISNRANNANLNALLGVVDAAGRDLPEQTWLEATRTLTALGFNLANTDFAAGAIDANAIAANAIGASEFAQAAADKVWASAVRSLTALGFTLGTADFAANYLTAALIANGAIDALTFAAGAVDANALATDAAEEIADALIGRNIAGGSNVGRLVSEALEILRNRRAIAAGIMTVYQADDITPSWTAGVATAPGNPVTDIDPV